MSVVAEEKKDSKKYKLPFYIHLFQVFLFFFPSIYFQLNMSITGKVMRGQGNRITSTPAMLLYQLVFLAATLFISYKTIRVLKGFDPEDEKRVAHINNKYRSICFGSIILVVLNAIIYPVIFASSANKVGVHTVELLPALMMSVGETLMFGMLFYLFWLAEIEKFLHILPFTKKDIVLSFKLKNFLVALFATLALILLSTESLLYSGYDGLPLREIFTGKVLPSAISGLIIIPIDFIILTNLSVSRIRDISKFSQVLSEGDYTQDDLKVLTRDDFGVLALNMNKFHQSTKDLLSGIGDTVEVTTEAAESTSFSMENITAATNQMINTIHEIQNQMNEQASSVEESTGAINEILQNIQNLNSSIEDQSAAVEESSAAVNEMVANIQSVSTILEKNEQSTNRLAEASAVGQEKVSDAVHLSDKIMEESKGLLEASSVIQNIAEQTNLLAMNAAIEAAHAGESGKGFSVVADEIRKLAEQSNEQGKRITESLQNLENVIASVAGSTNQLSDQFSTIYELTKVVKQQEEVVMAAMREQAEGSNQILLAMRNIGDITGNVKEGSAEMLAGGTQLSKEMELLNAATAATHNNVNEMANGAQAIINAVEKGNEASVKNNDSIQNLVTKMNKFKLD